MQAAAVSRPRGDTGKPTFDSVEDFVAANEGKRTIRKVLIANNGIAAVKCMRSVRTWAYESFGDDRAIRFTVMTTPEDLRANAEYVRMADEVIEVPGGSNNNNFANVRLICELAETCRADAVWAGWGHASENPALPDGLLDRGIAFIGPPSGPMRALGDKIGSTIIAQSADVPTIAWNGGGIRIDYKRDGLTEAVYAKANVTTAEMAEELAPAVGFPLMVKASEGGGGKGIRKVTDPAGLAAAFRQVQGEVPGSPIFLMRLASRARHLEVQLLADEYGEAISLSGRDCSVQRRHQKIVEEGPPVAAEPAVWREMERAAVRLAKEVGYCNAGTVEYLYTEHPPEGTATKFAFLELNPRLQVEHPVTEMITGVNLPAAQLQVAMGLRLQRIADVRKLYGKSANSEDDIDFETTEQRPPLGHVIASRITAENPDSGFQPTSGAITELNFRSTPNVWGYFSVDSSGRVHEYADSQIGHLFSFGSSREAARRSMVLALRELSIRGEIRTTVEYLAHMMESKDFVANRIDTQWLDRRITDNVGVGKPPATFVALMGAVVRCHMVVQERQQGFCDQLERGQCPAPGMLSVEAEVKLVYQGVRYSMQTAQAGPNLVVVSCNDVYVIVEARALADGGLLVLLGGRSHVVYWKDEPTGLRLSLDGTTCIFTAENDPSKLLADVSGKLVRFLVEDGAHVDKGQGFAEVEVMKMYMPLLAPEAGVLRHVQPEGSILEAGCLIACLDLDDPSRVPQATPFEGVLSDVVSTPSADAAGDADSAAGPSAAGAAASVAAAAHSAAISSSPDAPLSARRAHMVTRSAERTLRAVMGGYVLPQEVFDAAVADFDAAWQNPHLPLLELEEQMSVLSARLPASFVAQVEATISAHRASIGERRASRADDAAVAAAADSVVGASGVLAGPSDDETAPEWQLEQEMLLGSVRAAAEAAIAAAPAGRERSTLETTLSPVAGLCTKYAEGVRGARLSALCALLSDYVEVEKAFGAGAEGRRREDVLMEMRAGNLDAEKGSAALLPVYETTRAHEHVRERNVLVLRLLRRMATEIEADKNAAATATAARAAQAASASDAASASPACAYGALAGVTEADGASVGMGLSVEGDQFSSALSLADSISDAGRSDNDSQDGSASLHLQGTGGSGPGGPGAWDREERLLFALAELRGAEFAEVTLEARQMLILARQPSVRQRLGTIEAALRSIAAASASKAPRPGPDVSLSHPVIDEEEPSTPDARPDSAAVPDASREASASPPLGFTGKRPGDVSPWLPQPATKPSALKSLVRAELPLSDVLMRFFGHAEPGLRRAAVEVHIRRLYRAYAIRSITFEDTKAGESSLLCLFKFSSAPQSAGEKQGAGADDVHGMRKSGSLGGGSRSMLYAAGAADSVDNLQALAAAGSRVGASASAHGDGDLALPVGHGGLGPVQAAKMRAGVFAVFSTVEELASHMATLVQALSAATTTSPAAPGAGTDVDEARAIHVVHLAVMQRPLRDVSASPEGGAAHALTEAADGEVVASLEAAVRPHSASLTAAGVRRITVLVPPDSASAAAQRTHLTLAAQAGTARDGATGLRNSRSPGTIPEASLAGASAPAVGFTAATVDLPSSVVPPRRLARTASAAMLGAVADTETAAISAPATQSAALSGDPAAAPPSTPSHPCAFTLRRRSGFTEDTRIRHIQPPLSGYLELDRLSNFTVRNVPTPNRAVHVYEAQPAWHGPGSGHSLARRRFFVRAIVRHTERLPTLDSVLEQFPGPERMFVESLNALGVAMGNAARVGAKGMAVGNNHIFLNVLPTASVHPEFVVAVIRTLARKYSERLRVLRVAHVEFRILTRLRPGARPLALRLLCSNPTGYVLRVDAYVEVRDEERPSAEPVLASIPTSGPEGVILAARSLGVHGTYGADVSSVSSARAAVHASTSEAMRAGGGSAVWPIATGGGLAAIRAATRSAGHASSVIDPGVDALAAGARGDHDGLPVSTPYAVTSPFERRRALAFHMTETVFVYDFLELFQRALEVEWDRYNRQAARAAARSQGAATARRPRRLLVARELVLRPRRNPLAASSTSGPGMVGRSQSSELFSNEMGGSSRGPSRAGASGDAPDSPDPRAGPEIFGGASAPGGNAAAEESSSSASDVWFWDVEETTRPPGLNDIAMVAWRVTMFTPEFPESGGGRDVYIIANDITVSAGSFGVLEDALFFHASRLAREAGVPRLFLAANSGARIGLAEEVKSRFRVAWARPDDATKGFSYLYLSPEDHAELRGRGFVGEDEAAPSSSAPSGASSLAGAAGSCAVGSGSSTAGASASGAGSSGVGSSGSGSGGASGRPSVLCRRVVDEGEERWVLDDIIGRDDGLGVENLRGSGRIAGETSRSYRENFTLTYVTGRSVGIGAYLVRLGQRTIQKRTAAPILLTGYQALNKLIGAEVYTSNEQLGGPKIMYHNGVTHQVVDDDLAGVSAIMRWLAYVPSARGASLPVSPLTAALDPVDRPIAFSPGSEPYDPRHLLAGCIMAGADDGAAPNSSAAGSGAAASASEDAWTSGLFDRGSWTEYLAGWARTVVVGRARLGGIPIGVIIAETRTVSATRPADPATPQSQETTVQQAGQVWFPDSAFKTAQAIRDFAGEELPLVILANWRGFSGGQRDMFDEILKFGSDIVDALTVYKQPVFVYIPPGGELRGGAWVVVDPTINEDVMEMYAAPTGRGGVLEPAGIASIKFKARDIRAAARRLDPTLQALAASAHSAREAGDEDAARAADVQAEERLQRLTGVFTQISHHFADLHDRPGRMLAKGVIRASVPWERARGFFYWRLRRRLAEFALRRRIAAAAPQIGFAEAGQVLRSWFESTATSRGRTVGGQWDHDLRVLQWLADSRDVLDSRLAALARESITEQVLSLGRKDAGAAVDGILALMSKLPVDQREAVMGKLRKQVLFGPTPGVSLSVDPLLAGLPGTR